MQSVHILSCVLSQHGSGQHHPSSWYSGFHLFLSPSAAERRSHEANPAIPGKRTQPTQGKTQQPTRHAHPGLFTLAALHPCAAMQQGKKGAEQQEYKPRTATPSPAPARHHVSGRAAPYRKSSSTALAGTTTTNRRYRGRNNRRGQTNKPARTRLTHKPPPSPYQTPSQPSADQVMEGLEAGRTVAGVWGRLVLLVQGSHARQHLALQQLQGGTAAGGHVADLAGHASLRLVGRWLEGGWCGEGVEETMVSSYGRDCPSMPNADTWINVD